MATTDGNTSTTNRDIRHRHTHARGEAACPPHSCCQNTFASSTSGIHGNRADRYHSGNDDSTAKRDATGASSGTAAAAACFLA